MHAGACFALDDEELVAESRDDGEPYAESGAVIAGRHPHAVVGDEDPDALAVGRHADIDAPFRAGAVSIAVGVQHGVRDRLRHGQLDRCHINAKTWQHRADIASRPSAVLRHRQQTQIEQTLAFRPTHGICRTRGRPVRPDKWNAGTYQTPWEMAEVGRPAVDRALAASIAS